MLVDMFLETFETFPITDILELFGKCVIEIINFHYLDANNQSQKSTCRFIIYKSIRNK